MKLLLFAGLEMTTNTGATSGKAWFFKIPTENSFILKGYPFYYQWKKTRGRKETRRFIFINKPPLSCLQYVHTRVWQRRRSSKYREKFYLSTLLRSLIWKDPSSCHLNLLMFMFHWEIVSIPQTSPSTALTVLVDASESAPSSWGPW